MPLLKVLMYMFYINFALSRWGTQEDMSAALISSSCPPPAACCENRKPVDRT